MRWNDFRFRQELPIPRFHDDGAVLVGLPVDWEFPFRLAGRGSAELVGSRAVVPDCELLVHLLYVDAPDGINVQGPPPPTLMP